MIAPMEAWKQISLNVRFLLWRATQDRDRWSGEIEKRLQTPWPRERVEALLEGRRITDREVEDLVQAFTGEIEEEMFRLGDLAQDAGMNVLKENLKYLIGSLERGRKQEIAKDLDVDATTLSRWLAGTNSPPRPQQDRIAVQFGLPPSTKLGEDYLFLEYGPLSLQSRRQWLHQRVDKMTLDEMRDLFPAFQRLFRRT